VLLRAYNSPDGKHFISLRQAPAHLPRQTNVGLAGPYDHWLLRVRRTYSQGSRPTAMIARFKMLMTTRSRAPSAQNGACWPQPPLGARLRDTAPHLP
jgi:hypothetical protein